VELANGWEEETSREVLRERIDAANQVRAADRRSVLPLPLALLEAHGDAMPSGVGVALGFDRLVMRKAGTDSIHAVRCV
jgi:lysyl-tRNA synthetase class 2